MRRITLVLFLIFCALFSLWGMALGQGTALSWDGGGDGSSWSDPRNWSGDAVPTADDDVEILTDVTIELDTDTQTRALTLGPATLQGSGALTINGLFTWQNGTISGSGIVTARGGTVLAAGGTKTLIGRTLDLRSDTTWYESTLRFGDGAVINHHQGFTFTIRDDPVLAASDRQRRTATTHQDVPIVGTDPLADNPNLYAFNFFGDVNGLTAVNHRMSTNVLGLYSQQNGTTQFAAGSNLAGTFVAGESGGALFSRGTHRLSGQVKSLTNTGSVTATVDGSQTAFIFETGNDVQIPIGISGPTRFNTDTTLATFSLGDNSLVDVGEEITLSVPKKLNVIGFAPRIRGKGKVDAVWDLKQRTTLEEVTAQARDGSEFNADIAMQSGAQIQVELSGIVGLNNAAILLAGTAGNNASVEVTGTLTSSGTNRIVPALNIDSSGTLSVTSGTVLLDELVVDGKITGLPNAVVQLISDRPHIFNDGSAVQGAQLSIRKDVAFLGPNVEASGDVTFTRLNFNDGILKINGTTKVTESFTLETNVFPPQLNGTPNDRFLAEGRASLNSNFTLRGIQFILAGDSSQEDGTIFFQESARFIVPQKARHTVYDGEHAQGGTANNTPSVRVDGTYTFALNPGASFASNIPLEIGDTGTLGFKSGHPDLGLLNLKSGASMTVQLTDTTKLAVFSADRINLAGTLTLSITQGVPVQAGTNITVATTSSADGVQGQFQAVNWTGLPNGLAAVPVYTANRVQVEIREGGFTQGPNQNPKLNADSGGAVCDGICPDDGMAGIADPIYLHSGEFYLEETDLRIPGRGFDYQFARTYKSQIRYDGPLGQSWQHNYDYFLRRVGTDVEIVNGNARVDRYRSADGVTFSAPSGFYTRLNREADGRYTLRNAHGSSAIFRAPDGSPSGGKIASMTDRNGNRMGFVYDASGRLGQVIDTLGRTIDYLYNAQGRLDHIEDFSGRQVRFDYDERGDLVAVTGPAVSGTPTGNDFPTGKSWRYTYSAGSADPRLNHNLLTIIAPNQVADGTLSPRVINRYGSAPGASDFDRVIEQVWGGVAQHGVPAGGTLTLTYEQLNPAADPSDLALIRSRTTVVDRNGNRKEFDYNVNGNRLRRREYSNREIRLGDPEFWESSYTYNADGQRIRLTHPEGNGIEYRFDEANPDRLQQGNLLQIIRRADARRGGDQTTLETTLSYEPLYNQVRSRTEPRGNDPGYTPQNGGANSPERYTTVYTFDYEESCDFAALGVRLGRSGAQVQQLLATAGLCTTPLGDVNGDGRNDQITGNIVRTEFPTVQLLTGSNQAAIEGDTRQEIVSLQAFNQFGQPLYQIDPEGNVTDFLYFPENDPDGDGTPTAELARTTSLSTTTGGYLRERRHDARQLSGTGIPVRRNQAACPADLDVSGQIDAGDIRRAALLFRGGAGTAADLDGDGQVGISDIMALANRSGEPCLAFSDIRHRWFYDPVGNLVRSVDGRGIATDYAVNQLNQVVEITHAAAHDLLTPDPSEPLALTDFRYLERFFFDANDNLVLHQVEDRGNTSGVDGNPAAADLPTGVPNPDPLGGTAFVDTINKYDILDNSTFDKAQLDSM